MYCKHFALFHMISWLIHLTLSIPDDENCHQLLSHDQNIEWEVARNDSRLYFFILCSFFVVNYSSTMHVGHVPNSDCSTIYNITFDAQWLTSWEGLDTLWTGGNHCIVSFLLFILIRKYLPIKCSSFVGSTRFPLANDNSYIFWKSFDLKFNCRPWRLWSFISWHLSH